MKIIENYLAKYREKEAQNISIKKLYSHVLVIPAYKEGKFFINNLLELNKNVDEQVLVIIVVNNPANAEETVLEENFLLVKSLKNLGKIIHHADEINLIELDKIDLLILGPLVVDEKMAVGKARKIGADLALFLIQEKKVRCPLIYTTDADAILPRHYFQAAEKSICQDENSAGFIYPFRHLAPKFPKQRQSIELYERRLFQYVDGLSYAGSIYAFHTIGSIIAINAMAYAKVRGYPKIAAGEDFYLLNKLRKIGPIANLSGEPIKLSARVSDRVPFGTGPALKNIMQFSDVFDAPIFYHPSVFKYLRWVLQNFVSEFSIDKLVSFESAQEIDVKIARKALLSLKGLPDLRKHLSLLKQFSSKNKAFHDWFDAFRTLKFIHNLRDAGFAMQSYNNIVKLNY